MANIRSWDQLRRDLWRVAVARSDVGAALQACMLGKERVKSVRDGLHRVLIESAVMSYARPFSSNKPHGRLPERFARYATEREREQHRSIINFRNQLVAHSDAIRRSVLVMGPSRKRDRENARAADVRLAVTTELYDITQFDSLASLCQKLLDQLTLEQNKLIDQLFEGVVLP